MIDIYLQTLCTNRCIDIYSQTLCTNRCRDIYLQGMKRLRNRLH